MEPLNKIKHLLAKPFPQEESFFETFKIAAAISVFVVVFLFVFKPFGLHLQESGLFLLCLGFGIVTLVASIIYEMVVRMLGVKGEGAYFTFGKWVPYFIGAMLFISLANFLFVRIVLFDDIQWELFPYMIRGTFAVGVFPIIFIGAFAMLRQEKKYRNIADEINQKEISPGNTKQSNDPTIFDIPADRIRYIEAMQNYIKIGHVADDGQMREQTERATLKSLSNEVSGKSILRCHRSYLVNREFIVTASGNAQGLLLSLSDCEKEIPVSKSFVPAFRDH